MVQSKIFGIDYLNGNDDLEQQVNNWLLAKKPKIITILQCETIGENEYSKTISIWYDAPEEKIKTPKEDKETIYTFRVKRSRTKIDAKYLIRAEDANYIIDCDLDCPTERYKFDGSWTRDEETYDRDKDIQILIGELVYAQNPLIKAQLVNKNN